MVTNSSSVRSRSGRRGDCTAASAASSHLGRELLAESLLLLDRRDPGSQIRGARARDLQHSRTHRIPHSVRDRGQGRMPVATLCTGRRAVVLGWRGADPAAPLGRQGGTQAGQAPGPGQDLGFPALTEPREQVITALATLCAGDPETPPARWGSDRPRPMTYAATLACSRRPPRAPTRSTPACSTRPSTSRRSTAPLDAGPRARSRSRRRCSGWSGRPTGSRRTGSPAGSTSPVSASSRRTGAPCSTRSSARRPAAASSWTSGPARTPRSGGPTVTSRPEVATVRVLQQVGSRRMVVSHFNKATKGRLVRALLESGATPRTPAPSPTSSATSAGRSSSHDPGRHGQQLDVIVEDGLAEDLGGSRVEEAQVGHRDVAVRTAR